MYKFSEYNSSVLQVAGGKKDTIADSLSKRLLGNLSISHSPNLLLKKKNVMRHYLPKEIKTECTLFWGKAGQDKHISNTRMNSLWNWATYSFIMKNIQWNDFFFSLGKVRRRALYILTEIFNLYF